MDKGGDFWSIRLHMMRRTRARSAGEGACEDEAMTVLRDDTGKNYTPTAAENKGGGHHREVTLTFPKISAGAKSSEMVITDVAGVKERTFRWDLE
jgi:hypothetical protein